MTNTISSAEFKAALAAVCTPVTVVTTVYEGRAHGTTVSAFTSLSLDPPLVLVSLDKSSELLSLICQSRRYGVNVLALHQSSIALAFARKGADKFATVGHEIVAGLPRIHGASVWLECHLEEMFDGGDHMIAIGLVERAMQEPAEPLLYLDRSFRVLGASAGDRSAAVA